MGRKPKGKHLAYKESHFKISANKDVHVGCNFYIDTKKWQTKKHDLKCLEK